MRGCQLKLTTLAAWCVGALACGGAKTPEAKAPDQIATTPASVGAKAPAVSPTATNVSLSDEIRSKCGIPDEDAYFTFDSSRLTTSDRNPLDLVAKCFTTGPLNGRSVKLVGRADPRGPSDYNMTLGQARADAVETYLNQRGMGKAKTQSTSRGALDATGTDEPTWQKDRRVDVMVGM